MAGRPSELTAERAQAIALAVSEGHYLQHAAAAAGVARSSGHNWLARGRKARGRLDGGGEPEPDDGPYLDFLDTLEGAEKCAAELGIAPIRDAMERGDWRAAAWYLERRFPGHWRPGADGGARDEQDAAAAFAAAKAASEELLAKLKRLAEVSAEAEEREREDAAAGTRDPGEKRGRPADVARPAREPTPSSGSP